MKTSQTIFNGINPKFLQKLDKYLLLNYPRIWVTKIHYVFYYGLLANIILNLLIFFLIQPNQINKFIGFIMTLVMLAELVAFVYWFRRQCLFNLEQDCGDTNWINEFLGIIIYSFCILLIVSSSLIVSLRLDNQYLYESSYFHLFFIISATMIVDQKKYSKRGDFFYLLVYIMYLVGIGCWLFLLISPFFNIDNDESLFWLSTIIIFFIVMFLFFASCKLVEKKIYDQFLYTSFMIMPIAVFVLTLTINTKFKIFDFKDFIIVFLSLFLFFSPLQKWILNRTQSLPKK